jgi:hypothetical protein
MADLSASLLAGPCSVLFTILLAQAGCHSCDDFYALFCVQHFLSLSRLLAPCVSKQFAPRTCISIVEVTLKMRSASVRGVSCCAGSKLLMVHPLLLLLHAQCLQMMSNDTTLCKKKRTRVCS